MKEDNGIAVWNSLIDFVREKGSDGLEDIAQLWRSISARDSAIAIKHLMGKADGIKTIAEIFSAIKEHQGADAPTRSTPSSPLLSMRISNDSPYSATICLGHTAVGRKGRKMLCFILGSQMPGSVPS
jgi:hypothetical protein